MEKLGPDDDWDAEHVPQAIEIHAVSKFKHIFEMFDIPMHFKAQQGQVKCPSVKQCEAIIKSGVRQGKKCNRINCYIHKPKCEAVESGKKCNRINCSFHKPVIKQLIEDYLLKFYKKKLLTEEQCKCLGKYTPDNKKVSFVDYVRHANFANSLSKEEQEEKKQQAIVCNICGQPFDDSFWENADDKEETSTIIPKNTNKLKKFKEFEKLYWKQIIDSTSDEKKCKKKLAELHKEFIKTGIAPALIKKKPPKRSPLYKKKNRQKALDHEHLLEHDNFVGVSHSYCNLNRQPRRFFIPVFFHNGSNYDFRLLIRELIHFRTKGHDISVIAKSGFNFISVQFGIFKFLDSRRFLSDSEEVLANQLANRKDGKDTKYTNYDKFIQLRTYFENHERFKQGDWKLLTRKGALPYEYISPAHYGDLCLPPIEKFISKLTGKSITRDKYKELQNIWNSFGCKNLGEFLEIYLESDVLILADVFENFRDNCLKSYHLDPANFVSGPSLSYHALLLMSNVVFEPVPDLETYFFIERAKHGGLSQMVTRYSRAINTKSKALRKYFNEPNFDENALTRTIYYIDCNQLYPTAMLHPLPVGDYKFISTFHIDLGNKLRKPRVIYKNQEWIKSLDTEGKYGYLIEITTHTPKDKENRNNDLPPLPESLTPQQVSPYSSEHYDGEVPSEKLIAHLGTKNHIVNHFVEIQQAIKQGEVIDKIHRILRFRQAPFAKEYVTLNNNQRIIASKKKDEFGKAFFKLMNNSCFGQLMMDEKRFKHGKFVSSRKKKKVRGVEVSERKLAISDPKCIDYYDLDEDKENSFVLMNRKKTLTRPIACGCAIFGMSKSYIIEMWYKLIDKFGAENIHLIFTDTDSLCFELTGKNYQEADLIYYHIKNDPEFASLFDLRDVPGSSIYLWGIGSMKIIAKNCVKIFTHIYCF